MPRHPLTKTFLAVVIGLLSFLTAVPAASAGDISVNDPAGDVAYGRGDIISARAMFNSSRAEFRIRTRTGANPILAWSPTSKIRWRVDTGGSAMPEYFVDLQVSTFNGQKWFTGRVRYADTEALVAGSCIIRRGVANTNGVVTFNQNLYRFQFLRGCLGAPDSYKARASFIWDEGTPNVGPVYTDFAPNNAVIGPVSIF
jgi:hypothetical protein